MLYTYPRNMGSILIWIIHGEDSPIIIYRGNAPFVVNSNDFTVLPHYNDG
jgi:hypothetical protein